MSRLLLLSTGGAFGGGEGPPPEPTGPVNTYPVTVDATVLALRPGGRVLGTLTVDTDWPALGTNFHTIGDAITYAKTLQESSVQGTSLAPGEFSVLGSPYGPDYRVDVIIGAGTYTESAGGSAFINLVGATGNPDDVIWQSNATGGGTLHAFGTFYMEGIHFKSLTNGGAPDTGPKYALHITAGGPGALVAARCKFISTNPGGSGSVGQDGGNGLLTYFYACDLSAPSGTMNLHGGDGNTQPVTVVFDTCTNNGTFSYSEIGGAIDSLWVVGCTPNTATTSGSVAVYTTGTPPLAADALADSTYYYPSAIGTQVTQTFGSDDAIPYLPPLSRVYFVPIDVPSAIHFTHHGVVSSQAGGVVGVRATRLARPPTTTPGTQSLGTLVSGVNEAAFYYFNTLYPGEGGSTGHLWMIVSIDSGSPMLMGSLTQAAGAYMKDGAGAIVPVPGSTRVPVVQLRSATG